MNNIEVDDKQVRIALGNLDSKKMNKAYREALKKSVEPIQKQAKSNLRKSGIKGVNKKYVSKTGREYGSMLSGIKTSVDVHEAGEEWAKVHIMGEFRLKWFEKGTSLRKTDKGWDRGSIRPHWFFRSAVMEKGKESQSKLEDNIKESIIRAWQKK